MPNTVVIGAQWGDEGKGKIVDVLSEKADIVARYQGGANAGHTVVVGDRSYVLHLIPSGILRPDTTCVIGNGVVLSLESLIDEIETLEALGVSIGQNLMISNRAHLIMPYHYLVEATDERNPKKIGTTLRGIGPAYMDKMHRQMGIRVADLFEPELFAEKVEYNLDRKMLQIPSIRDQLNVADLLAQYRELATRIEQHVTDTSLVLHTALKANKQILFEGAQGTLLDVDFGTYPYVTSSNTTVGGVCTGLGVGPQAVDEVVGIVKAYTTRVGEGPFPTEYPEELGHQIRELGQEYGATTGRPRRCGWLDGVALRYAMRINGMTQLAITKLDVLDSIETIRICVNYNCDGETIEEMPASLSQLERCEPVYEEFPGWGSMTEDVTAYSDLPKAARMYLERIEALTETPIQYVSVGARRDQIITLG